MVYQMDISIKIGSEAAMGEERFRLVVLGSSRVGKTSIIRRYLYHEFSAKYKETVEDLHSRQFRIRGVPLPLDILDTNFNFPDMRRLAISSASAFLLVFAVDDVQSFKEMSDLWQEICARRSDIAALPTVVVGNKADLPSKKIYEATAQAWTSRLSSEVRYLEVSAKDDSNVTSIFRNLLQLSGFPKCKAGGGCLDEEEGERENAAGFDPLGSPAHVGRAQSIRSRPLSRSVFTSEKSNGKEPLGQSLSLAVPADLKRNRSLRMKSAHGDSGGGELAAAAVEEPTKLSRSRSLIRRTKHLSLKMRRHGERPPENVPDESDCVIS